MVRKAELLSMAAKQKQAEDASKLKARGWVALNDMEKALADTPGHTMSQSGIATKIAEAIRAATVAGEIDEGEGGNIVKAGGQRYLRANAARMIRARVLEKIIPKRTQALRRT